MKVCSRYPLYPDEKSGCPLLSGLSGRVFQSFKGLGAGKTREVSGKGLSI